jgi:hypothetical protein
MTAFEGPPPFDPKPMTWLRCQRAATWSAMRCARDWSAGRKHGLGRVYGCAGGGKFRPGCPHGRRGCQRAGWSTSTASRPKRNWRPCGAVWVAGCRGATKRGTSKQCNGWDWRQPCGRVAGLVSHHLHRPLDIGSRTLFILVKAIATHIVGNRPDRFEPRFRKRRPKPYKHLREHRRNYQTAAA